MSINPMVSYQGVGLREKWLGRRSTGLDSAALRFVRYNESLAIW